MGWPLVIAAGATLIGSWMQKKSAKKGYDQQAEYQQDQLALDRERLDWGKEQYGDWKEKFDPMYDQVVNEMDQDLTPNYGEIAGDVKSGFEGARESNERNLMRYGINPRDGSMQTMNRDYGIRGAAAHVGARNQARESKRGILYDRKAQLLGQLSGTQHIPANMVAGGYNATGNTMNQMGNSAVQRGISNGQGWNDMAGAVGQVAGGVDWMGLASSVRSNNGGGSGGTAGRYGGI